MKTVIVIGAGATRAEAESQKASRAQRPPLDGDFFELAQIREELAPHRERVQAFVKKHFDIDVFQSPRPGMEQIFAHVYSSTSIRPLAPGVKEVFSSLCRIYAKVIEESTNWIKPTTKGPLCRLIRKVVSTGETTIITFNQDIVIEKVLDALTAANCPVSWELDQGYKLPFASITSPKAASELDKEKYFVPRSSQIPINPILLKPHGSLNWYAKTLKKDSVLSQLKPSHKINCTRRKELATTMQFTSANDSGRKTWYTWPIIVPPILEKGNFLGNALDSVWDECWRALTSAERVIVYGYSFPAADAQSRTFFKRASVQMANRPMLVTINPDLQSSLRAAEIFKPAAHISCDTVRTYLSAEVRNGIVI